MPVHKFRHICWKFSHTSPQISPNRLKI